MRATAAIRGGSLQPVGWTPDAERATIQDVGIDHGRADVRVTEQFLDGANVVPILEQMCRERMTEGVGADPLRNPRRTAAVTAR